MPEGKLARGGLRSVALLCASLAVLFALLTFIGWISGLQLLASVRARYIPMAPSTALCFSLLGIGIVLHLKRPARRWVPRLLAAVVLIMAVAKLVEFLSDLHFGIDAWFVRNPEMFGDGADRPDGADDGTGFCLHRPRSDCANEAGSREMGGHSGRAGDNYQRGRAGRLLVRHASALRWHYHSGRALDRLGIFPLRYRDCRCGWRGRVAACEAFSATPRAPCCFVPLFRSSLSQRSSMAGSAPHF